MSRSVPEWIGKDDDERIPPRVKLRIFERYNQRCCNCELLIVGRLLPNYDHVIPLINGGSNRESNIQLLCSECHKDKTKGDIRDKSNIYNKRIRRLKLRKKRPIPGSKGSGFRRKMDGTVIKVKE